MENIKLDIKILVMSSVLVIASITSCSEDFIDLTPPSSVTVDLLYKTEADFQQALIGVYTGLRGHYAGYWEVGDLRADDVWQEATNQTARVLTDNFQGHTAANNLWSNGFIMFNRANLLLEKIQLVDIPNKEIYIAETKFLRALGYFNLIRVFGPVPFIIGSLSPEDAYKTGRAEVDRIYNELIIPDLIEGANTLPTQYSGSDIGRATQGAAKALLGKVYLTRKNYVEAEKILREVTTMGYELLDDYNSVFDHTNKHHKEYIFDIEYTSAPNAAGNTMTSICSANWPVVRSLYGMVGTLHDSCTPRISFRNLFEAGDKRRDISAALGVTTGDGVFQPLPPRWSAITGKYLSDVPSADNGNANFPVIRYADVLLMLSEALNENGKTGEALEFLNQVRARAGVAAFSGLSQTETRNSIELERRLELNMEGHRWFDLIRWGKALQVLTPLGMEPHMILWPLPQNEVILINDPSVLPQNPGYD
ncbi:RagB/SusD family nutrient uptake outer membrane protein [Cognataquiflexum rubidum]|uniref:RagB/SusD family nutrient uptake outer membrane protein n=1 Tax=Cognataquiflexum rubidum TaxID=2922273 RepID=UPI001F145929|nr:RagB/SusD family nutrient uptake outer membrane protein [Cognataquiflexum rubidum]MCH6233166.1 RagB/SusD family nutrient uptake outer membrane protein [Cognataquiflexum rubidum]